MKFKLEFDMGNAAFEDAPGEEIARILRKLAAHLAEAGDMRPGYQGALFDFNGNKVGEWKVKR